MAQSRIHHDKLGLVVINFRRNSSRVSARWLNGYVQVVTPYGVNEATLRSAIDRMAPALLASRPKVSFAPGTVWHLDGGINIYFEEWDTPSESVWVRRASDGGAVVMIGRALLPSHPQLDAVVSRVLVNAAYVMAYPLVARARELAEKLGAKPADIDISRGHKTLGTCSSRGEVKISCMCVFLPQELRDFVICHELAHLTHHDHSAEFHALVDEYTGGREAELEMKLMRFEWPIIR